MFTDPYISFSLLFQRIGYKRAFKTARRNTVSSLYLTALCRMSLWLCTTKSASIWSKLNCKESNSTVTNVGLINSFKKKYLTFPMFSSSTPLMMPTVHIVHLLNMLLKMVTVSYQENLSKDLLCTIADIRCGGSVAKDAEFCLRRYFSRKKFHENESE